MAAKKNNPIRASKRGDRKSTKKSPGKRGTLVGGRARKRPDRSVPLPEPSATFEF